MSDKPHFLAGKFQDFQRLSARGFACPICNQSYQHESKIWEHAQREHLDVLGLDSSADQTEIRKKFRIEAMERAHQILRKVNRDVGPIDTKQTSNDNDSTRPNVGDDVKPSSSLRPMSAPVPSAAATNPEVTKEIDGIKDLQLSQDREARHVLAARFVPQSPVNPLKRGAVAETDRSGTLSDSAGHRIANNRRTKTLSGELSIDKEKDPDFRREPYHPTESYDPRNLYNAPKRLFDPNTDTAGTVPRFRGGPQENPRRLYDARSHVFRSRKAPPGDRGTIDPKIIINCNFDNEGSIKKVDKFSSQDAMSDQMDADAEMDPEILLQPETRPISHDQLVVEVKGIYAGLVMLEAKCIDVDEKQFMEAQEKLPSRQTLSDEQWQALITLHKTLLHEHHDFFLASQHPSASSALSRLAAKYSMPARMWRHGIHAFLEVLRHRLPQSLDHMLAFIYIAYSMMALLYETVPTFEDTWIECLGDLGRYRMAIENEDPRDRDVWSGVARFWYSKAADKSPNVGRLYHHLAILARPYTLQQLSYYTRSLTCVTPFESAKASIMTHFTPILNGKESAYHRASSLETVFIKAHGILFCGRSSEEFEKCLNQIKDHLLDNFIGRITAKFKEQGVFIAIACIAALFEYGISRESGSSRSIFRLAFEKVRADQIEKQKLASLRLNDEAFDVGDQATRPSSISDFATLTPSDMQSSRILISQTSRLAFSCLSIALSRVGDKNVFPLVHVYFVFFWSLAAVEKAMAYVERDVPWTAICSFLNTMTKPYTLTSRVQAVAFPKPAEGIGRPLPEDFLIRGQMYSQWYFPETWFRDAMIDDEERVLELPSMAESRVERILWLGFRLVSFHEWIDFDHTSQNFYVTPHAAELLEASSSRGGSAPGDLQISKDGDTLMPDINASEELQAPEVPLDTHVSSPAKEHDSPIKIRSRDGGVAMKGIDAEEGSNVGSPQKFTNPDTVHWLKNRPEVKAAKKDSDEVYASDRRKVEKMRNFDQASPKKQLHI